MGDITDMIYIHVTHIAACMVSPKEELFHVFSYGDLRHWLVGLVLTVKTQAAVSHACHATSA